MFSIKKTMDIHKDKVVFRKGDEGRHGDNFNGGISLNPHFVK